MQGASSAGSRAERRGSAGDGDLYSASDMLRLRVGVPVYAPCPCWWCLLLLQRCDGCLNIIERHDTLYGGIQIQRRSRMFEVSSSPLVREGIPVWQSMFVTLCSISLLYAHTFLHAIRGGLRECLRDIPVPVDDRTEDVENVGLNAFQRLCGGCHGRCTD